MSDASGADPDDLPTLADQYWHELEEGRRLDPTCWLASQGGENVELEEELELLELLSESRRKRRQSSGFAETEASGSNTNPSNAAASRLPDGAWLDDHVRIICFLKGGGMGEVYIAWHELMDQEVAIKVLPKEKADDPEAAARFAKSIKDLVKLDGHEHIVTTRYAGRYEGRVFLVMEYVDGFDLHDYVQDGPSAANALTGKQRSGLPWREACDYIRQAASGLAHAHQSLLYHRDIKPSNLIRKANGKIKVLDWGVSRAEISSALNSQATRSDTTIGTLDYMSPEQYEDPTKIDGRADIYSLGATFYYLLTAEPPFGRSRNTNERTIKIKAHATAPRPSVRDRRPHVPPAIEKVIKKMMAIEPRDRYPDCEAVMAAIDAATSPQKRGGGVMWLAAATLLIAVGAWLWNRNLQNAMVMGGGKSGTEAVQAAGAVTPVVAELEELRFFVQQPSGEIRYYDLVKAGTPFDERHSIRLTNDESFRIDGKFKTPVTSSLLWFDTKGLLDPPTKLDEKSALISFPASGKATKVNAADPPGTHLLMIVVGPQTKEAETRLREVFVGRELPPGRDFRVWVSAGKGSIMRGQGELVATQQSYVEELRTAFPTETTLVAVIFLPAGE